MSHEHFSIIQFLVLVIAAIAVFFWIFGITTIYEYQRGVLFYFGRFHKILGPGWNLTLRLSQKITVLDIRPIIQVIPGQELVTSDGIGLKASLVATYEIVDPHKAITGVVDYKQAVHLTLQLAIREIISPMPIDDVLIKREEFGEKLMSICSSKIELFGIKLIQAEVRDLTIPADMKVIFAQVVKARKEGQAILEKARGETAALRSLANSAKMIEGNPALLQLRTLHTISEFKNATVVINVPNSIDVSASSNIGSDQTESIS
jgi:regulator of protease activity HflC (stomatin/prohibitin superfamily)